MSHTHPYENIVVTKLPNSEVTIAGSVSVDHYLPYRAKVVRRLLASFELPGFRKGHVPEATFIAHVGEPAILGEVAEDILGEIYPEIVTEQKLSVIGSPQISITKLAEGNPIEFSIKTAIYPSITLPDYQALAKEANAKEISITVTEQEVEDTIKNLRKSRIPEDAPLSKEDAEQEENWPTYDDEFVRSLGAFADVADFETKLRDGIKTEKERAELDKRRLGLFEALIAKSSLEVPSVLIDSELHKMLSQFEGDVVRMGIPFEKYLEHIKKTPDDLMREWKGDAEKRAKLEIILHEIKEKEKLEAPKERVEEEVAHIIANHKDADPLRVRLYVLSMLEKEEVMKFLDAQK